MKKKVGIIGQFPPPIHGLSKALDTLYNSYLKLEFNFTKIDITNNKKFVGNLYKILFSKLDLYYLTISQSKFGNIRDLIIIKLIQLKQRKIIIHLHGGGFRNSLDNEFGKIQRQINYKILSKVDGGIVLGNSLKYIFKDIISDEKIFIVKNCVDDEFIISDEEFNNKLESINKKDKYNVVYLSNFIEEKGYKESLKLAKLVKENNDNRFRFIFAGKFFDKEDKDYFYDFINKNNLSDIIDYRGVVNGNEKMKVLREGDIFMLLTRYKNEGQPISIIEAAANGLKIISTDHAGIKDILSEEEMIIVNKNNIDVQVIYNELISYIENLQTNTLCNIRKNMINTFSEENYLNNLKEIFNIM